MIRRSAAVSSSGRGVGGVDEASVDSDNTPLVSNGVGGGGGGGGGGLRGRRLKSGSRAAPRVPSASDEGVRLDGDYRVEGEDGPPWSSSWSSSGGRASSTSASTTNRLLTAILVVLTVLVLLHANNFDNFDNNINLGGDSFDEDPHALIERYDALRRQRESALTSASASARPDDGVPVPESVVDSVKDTGVAEETKEEVPVRPVDDVAAPGSESGAVDVANASVATAGVDATSAADTTPDTAPDVSATTTTATTNAATTTTTNNEDVSVSDAATATSVTAPAGGSRTVAYVLPVYDCPSDGEEEEEAGRRVAFADAAAVLKYSVHRATVRGRAERADDDGGHYDYQMVALLHPCFADTERPGVLAALGYRVLVRDVLVPRDQIRGDYLRRNVGRQLPDGDRDTVRLHAHALTEYPVVVALDARSLLLRPLDELFDALLAPPESGLDEDALRRIELAPPRDEGGVVDRAAVVARVRAAGGLSAFVLRDTLSVAPNGRFGVDPGLFVIKPSLDVHRELRDAYRAGDFRPDGAGWAGKGHGGYRGAMTFKGLSAHYYDDVRPGVALELDRCAYNNVADRPTVRTPDGKVICRDRATVSVAGDGNVTAAAVGESGDAADCEDCRDRPLDRVRTINLSACRSPWDCFVHDPDDDRLRLCRDMHATWYRMRDELETNWVDYGPWGGAPSYVPAPRRGNATSSSSLNFCAPGERGRDAYAPMRPPTLGTPPTATTTGADRRRRTLRANNQRHD